MTDQPGIVMKDRAGIAAAFAHALNLPEREFVQCALRSHYGQSEFRDLRLATRGNPESDQAHADMMLARLGDVLEDMLRTFEPEFGGITLRSVELLAPMLIHHCRVNIYADD